MDNPKICSWNIMDVGDSFVFKGDYCTVTKIKGYGFNYSIQNSTVNGYMDFNYYSTTPSFKGKNKFW
jgi:hypothetical protein